ncbi:hypothetical protein [Qaidamihabitans albus]|uniref:hypothetical protein n=1 Tax=Qaidamihabitans albus TaxID=2795733 RepID=UPI0018F1A7F9|nr:hypothetical protein [Qaidamihabitans albus]
MDLRGWLSRRLPVRPLVVPVPGGTASRLAAERTCRTRGWYSAASPAEANLLVVAGATDGALEAAVERVWQSMPAPRARAAIARAEHAEGQLDAAEATLRDTFRQRRQATETVHPGPEPEMAGRGEDRDGLMLDQLTVPLGPVLPEWPAGLVLHTTVQGDVIQDARVELLGLGQVSGGTPWWPYGGGTPRRGLAARHLDTCASLLTLAGAGRAAITARRLRDDVLLGRPAAELTGPLRRWSAGVRRSWPLRWLLSGLGPVDDDLAPPPHLAGDVLARLRRFATAAEEALADLDEDGALPGRSGDESGDAQWTIETLPRLLAGSELAAARLLVASLDPDIEALTGREVRP